jgi:hypothetical protein
MSVMTQERERQALTMRYPHVVVAGEVCSYCDRKVVPRFYKSGRTVHLDHFMPVCILRLLESSYPYIPLTNYLLPSCSRCNNIAQSYVFLTIADKHDYVRAKLELPARQCSISGSLPLDIWRLFLPIDELCCFTDRIVICPHRTSKGWFLGERAFRCNGPTISMEL